MVQGRAGVLQVHALPGAQDASVQSGGRQCGREVSRYLTLAECLLSGTGQQLQPGQALPGHSGQRGHLPLRGQQRESRLRHRHEGGDPLRSR